MTKPKVRTASEHTDRAIQELDNARFKVSAELRGGNSSKIARKANRTIDVVTGALSRMNRDLKNAGL